MSSLSETSPDDWLPKRSLIPQDFFSDFFRPRLVLSAPAPVVDSVLWRESLVALPLEGRAIFLSLYEKSQ